MRKFVCSTMFLLILTFTNGYEGHEKKAAATVLTATGVNGNSTLPAAPASDTKKGTENEDYASLEWHNNDDYLDPSNSQFTQIIRKDSAISTSTIPPASTPASATNSETKQSEVTTESESTEDSTSNVSSSTTPESSSSPSESNATSSTPDVGLTQTESSTPGITSPSNSSTEAVVTSTSPSDSTQIGNSTSTQKIPPSSITTQDVGDISNYTSTEYWGRNNGADGDGLAAWAVVIASVFISFALIFTVLYFIRSILIRRRKEDQRRLLRASISSEGYFYGDGDGSMGGKFEL